MPDQFLIFTYPTWWLLPIVLVAGLLSWFLYNKKDHPWSVAANWFLASLRFLTLFLLLSLTLDPIANLVTYEQEPPIVALAIDNSTSVLQNQDSAQLVEQINQINRTLTGQDYLVPSYDLSGKLENRQLTFTATRSNLNQQLKDIVRDYEDQNLAAVIQLTDGIVTNGFLPSRSAFGQPILTVGLGDTIPPKDIRINTVISNKIVYLGNLFNANILISSDGYQGETVELTISKNGRQVKSDIVTLNQVQEIQATLEASEPGLFRYTVTLSSKEDEVTIENNSFSFFVDVIDGKENILVVAPAPHPDIRSIRTALDQSENYETYLHIPGLHQLDKAISYDVIIYHDAFNSKTNLEQLEGFENTPSFYLANSQPRLQRLNASVNLQLDAYENQSDNVIPAINPAFSKFQLDDEFTDRLARLPTVTVPYATYQLRGPHEILLYQQVGRIKTQKPLLSFYDDGNKKFALMMSTGIWKWKLQETAISGSNELFDEIILKTIQYLSIRNNKKRFSAMPIERMFEEGEQIRFDVEIYNSIYERIGGQAFTIAIENEQDSSQRFDFISSDQVKNFQLGSFPVGTYNFEAATLLDGKSERVNGQFLIKNIQVENIQQQADHQMLKQLSRKTGGEYFHSSAINELIDYLEENEYPVVIRSNNEFIPLRNSAWVLAFIILLAISEWFLRKYLGGY